MCFKQASTVLASVPGASQQQIESAIIDLASLIKAQIGFMKELSLALQLKSSLKAGLCGIEENQEHQGSKVK